MKRFLIYLFIIIVLLSTSGCIYNREALMKYSSNGDYDKLINYINKNYDNSNNSELILLAINEIVNSKNNDDLIVLEELFYKDVSDEIKLEITSAFNNKDKLFKSFEKLNDYFFENYKRKENAKISTEVLKMLIKYKEDQLIKYNINAFEKKYNSNEFEEAHIRLVLLKELFPNKRNSIEALINKFEKLVEVDIDIEEVKNQISELENKIDEIKSALINSDYFSLEAFVIAEMEPNFYEIAIAEKGYYTSIPSDNHAYLITSKTKFTSKGRFVMNVVKMYEEDVKLKEQFGGFTQKWNVYYEITDEYIETMKSNKKELEKFKKELDEKKKKIDSMYVNKKNKNAEIDNITRNFKNMDFNIDIPKTSKKNNEENRSKTSQSNDEHSQLEDLILDFDNSWIEYVNNNSEGIFNYIVPNSKVEDNILNFNRKDLNEEFLKIDVKEISINKNIAKIKVYEKLKKDKNGLIEIKEYNWIYEAQKVQGKWLLSNYTKDKNVSLSDDGDKYTEEWAERNVSFIKKGTVKGGILTDGIDVSKIRLANQKKYERLVLDFKEFSFDGSGSKVSKPCYFEVQIVDGNKSIITLNGARGITADLPALDSGNLIETIEKVYPEDDSMVQLIINYKKSINQRIFELHNPGRLVIDIKE